MILPAAEAKGLSVHVAGEGGTIFTDGGKVRQILINLLSNAVKFTDSGEINIAVTRNRDDASVAVSDTGIGIVPDDLERVFDPFWQVEQRSTRRAGGTGLGLSVSRTLARLIGGEVRVQSEPGKGSTFTLTLPARRN
jgi:signal transduction histidine kinase